MLPERTPRRADALPVTVMDRHFSINEICEQWNMPYTTVLELFRDEPGVVRKPKVRTKERRDPGRPKRAYGIIRVPESVMRRVYSRMVVS